MTGERAPVTGDKLYKVTFEFVAPEQQPWCYSGNEPTVAAADVPDEYWSTIERVDDRAGALVQYLGLHKLAEVGELVRNVRLHEGVITGIDWKEISR